MLPHWANEHRLRGNKPNNNYREVDSKEFSIENCHVLHSANCVLENFAVTSKL